MTQAKALRDFYDILLPMTKQAFEERRKSWVLFHQWEAQRQPPRDDRNTLRLIGECVDFFISRHSQRSKRPDVSGILEMRRRLSLLSHA